MVISFNHKTMEIQQTSAIQPEEFFTFKESATLWQMSESAFYKLVKNHKQELGEGIVKMVKNGRRQFCINALGMERLKRIKNNRPVGENQLGVELVEKEREAKAIVAQKDEQAHATIDFMMQDPIIQMRMSQIQLENRVKKIEDDKQRAIESIKALPPPTVKVDESPRRKDIWRVVNLLVQETGGMVD